MKTKDIIAACALVAASAAAQAHAKLESSLPKANSELAAPAEIRLRFNEPLEGAFSKIALVDAGQGAVALPAIAIDKADPNVMFAAPPPLKPGKYEVRWTAMTRDGHKVKGQYVFSVK